MGGGDEVTGAEKKNWYSDKGDVGAGAYAVDVQGGEVDARGKGGVEAGLLFLTGCA